jgi:DNA-binding NarL/FixJ family response regulator
VLPEALPLLRELGCAPPLFKPAHAQEITAALHMAIGLPPSPIAPSALLTWAGAQADALKQAVRARRVGPRVAVLADCDLIRIGLCTSIAAAGGNVLLDTASWVTLLDALGSLEITLIVAEAGCLSSAALARECPAPILAVASSLGEAQAAAQIARGVVVMPVAMPTLAQALTSVAAGERYHDARLLKDPFTIEGLSATERALIHLVAQGRQPVEIARQLNLAHTTVRHYLSRIYAKLEVADLQTLRRWAEERLRR